MSINVAFVGLGNMGNPMAMNILKKGFAMTVFDLNANTMQNLTAAGAKGAANAADAIKAADVLITSLPGSPEVEAFYLNAGGALELAKAGATLIDLSSVLPATPRKIEERAKARGLKFLEAPVSGGVTGARAATLAVMTGGDAAVLEQVRPILNAIGTNIYHVGPVGAGNTIKAINNMLSTVNACALMEGLSVGLKAGLSLKTMGDIIKASSGNSNAIPRIDRSLIPRDFEPGFKVALMNKDLDTFHAIAKSLHVPVSFSNMAQHYQQAALAAGLSEKDTSVIFTLIEARAGIAKG
ncbi:MAG: NAD(P)-dependent oxidoreductase [Betaproteobacteria bacterium]|nr:NAD(P)-dependent oxidoreductase [Betaproteobacteria bacterium]